MLETCFWESNRPPWVKRRRERRLDRAATCPQIKYEIMMVGIPTVVWSEGGMWGRALEFTSAGLGSCSDIRGRVQVKDKA